MHRSQSCVLAQQEAQSTHRYPSLSMYIVGFNNTVLSHIFIGKPSEPGSFKIDPMDIHYQGMKKCNNADLHQELV